MRRKRGVIRPGGIAVRARRPGNYSSSWMTTPQYFRRLARSCSGEGTRSSRLAEAVDALNLAEEHEGEISLLLTDVVMPGMGGRQLSGAFREGYPSVRVLFMSAYTEDEVILQGVRVAEVDFIPKPFTVQGLRDKVGQVLGRTEEG
jgi:CheY-like chemotaxis protein